MQTEVGTTTTNHTEIMNTALELLRKKAQKLDDESRQKANQHANDLADRIERLDFQTRIAGSENEQRASGALRLLNRAWADLGENIKNSTKDVQRELEKQH